MGERNRKNKKDKIILHNGKIVWSINLKPNSLPHSKIVTYFRSIESIPTLLWFKGIMYSMYSHIWKTEEYCHHDKVSVEKEIGRTGLAVFSIYLN